MSDTDARANADASPRPDESSAVLRRFSIVGWLYTALLAVAAVAVAVTTAKQYGVALGLALTGFYVASAVVYLVLSQALQRWASAVGDFESDPGPATLEQTIERRQRFWRIGNTVASVYFVLLFLAFLGILVWAGLSIDGWLFVELDPI